MSVASKEAKQFCAMLALIKCAQQYAEYLNACKAVHGTVKHEMNGMFNRFKVFQDMVTRNMTAADKEIWEKEWNRDYLSFSAVFEHMADMNDNQRELMEQLAEAVLKNEITAILQEQ